MAKKKREVETSLQIDLSRARAALNELTVFANVVAVCEECRACAGVARIALRTAEMLLRGEPPRES